MDGGEVREVATLLEEKTHVCNRVLLRTVSVLVGQSGGPETSLYRQEHHYGCTDCGTVAMVKPTGRYLERRRLHM